MENALKHFKNIQDPRSIRNQKHPIMTLIGTTLLAVNPEEFYAAFLAFTESLSTVLGQLINNDGKTIKHSGHEKALHIVSAWCHSNQLVLAQ